MAFVAGGLAAALLALALVAGDRLLEGATLWGRSLLWHAAVLGAVLAASRSLADGGGGGEGGDGPGIGGGGVGGAPARPYACLAAAVAHTHWLPRRWRGRAHTRDVADEFLALFPYAAAALAEELLSVVACPLLLWCVLPRCAPRIVDFAAQFTCQVDGLGGVCSLAAFDFGRHGSARYGAPRDAGRAARSGQGKARRGVCVCGGGG